jgi:hypothetical protein
MLWLRAGVLLALAVVTDGIRKCHKGYAIQISQEGGRERFHCFACPAGKFASVTGERWHSVCFRCPAGKFSSKDASTDCESCTSGRYLPSRGKNSCLECAAGKHLSVGGIKGVLVGGIKESECRLCTQGQYSAAGAGNCTAACEAGAAQSPEPGSSACYSCAPNKYSDRAGAKKCSVCPKCAPGYLLTGCGGSAEGTCDPCALGRYAGDSFAESAAVAEACLSCPQGKYGKVSAAEKCHDCGVGEFSARAEATACAACPQNKFQPRAGGKECFACAPGQWTSDRLVGTTADDVGWCAPGYHSFRGGCAACALFC